MLLTAVEIDNNKLSIDKRLDEIVSSYLKVRLSKKFREYKKLNEDSLLKITDDKEKAEFLDKIKEQLKEQIKDDDETKNYREQQREILISKSENYFVVRETLNDLNELNEFSADIERSQLQLVDNFKTPDELVKLNIVYYEKFKKYKQIRHENIDNYLKSYKDKKLPFNDDDLSLVIKMRELYKIDKTVDDIELFDKYDMQTNIDFSNKLGDYYLHKQSNNNFHENIVNDWYRDTTNPIEKLSKRIIINNKFLGLLLLTNSGTGRTSFISNNSVTCLATTYSNNVNNKLIYVTRTLGELFLEITNPELSDIPKETRQQIYMTYDGTRPTSDMYYKWNGLQVFDIDLKEWDQVNLIEIFKRKLYEQLSNYHWFLWICKSSSGKGIHIYTKVTPPHHVYTDVTNNEYISKYWHKINYWHKSTIIYDLIRQIHLDKSNTLRFNENVFNDNYEINYLDNSVGRITSGIRLSYDKDILVNYNFLDLHVSIFDLKQDNIEKTKINLFRLTKINNKFLDNISDLTVGDIKDMKEKISEEIDLSKYEFAGDFNNIQLIPRNQINYNIRYNVVNTLAAMFGKDGLPLAHKILQSEECKNVKEINSFYSCAISNKKEPTKLGLDILKKVGILKSIKQEVKTVTDNIFKNGIKKAIEKSLNNKFEKPNIELGPTEFLSDKNDILLNPLNGGFTNDKINILLSPPGSGKTYWLLELARQGKKILLVEPFISVIKNKVESDEELMKIFQVFYDSVKLDELLPDKSAICTFDKFARCNYEKVSNMFDYVCIDESHLLFTSSYRIDTTSASIRKIKELFFISSNNPFAAKLILMTGTETGDTYFFGDIGNVIRVNKKSNQKDIEFLICDDSLDCVTRLSNKAYQLINEGYRLLIPTNKGEIYSQKLIGMVEHLLQREVKFGYYKRSNTEQEICKLINEQNTVGDYEIIFCSNYLSVGVDIIDKCKFASLYFGPFSGYEVEQFNARIRKTGIKTIYCIQTETNDGTTNDLLIEEPNLVLKLTEEDIENFKDDKQIAKAKQEFIAQYDPVLHKIVTPGFSVLNNVIKFNKEEYELTTFENKFLEVMVHPVKVARELSKYGYNVSISDEYEGLSLAQQEELKKIGLNSARNEKIRKHNLLVGTYIDLCNKNSFVTENGIEWNDFISWIGKHKELIVEDRSIDEFVKVDINLYSNPEKIIVKSKEAFDFVYSPAKYICSKYSKQKAIELIYNYVDEAGILKKKTFTRTIHLMKLVDKADSNELAEPTFKTIEKMYEWLDKFSIDKGYRISYNTYQADLDVWTNSYIDMLGIKINTSYGFQKIKDNIIEMLNDLATKNTNKEGIRFDYNTVPNEDGVNYKHKKSVDTMIEKMFNITADNTTINKKPREKHVILVEQNW